MGMLSGRGRRGTKAVQAKGAKATQAPKKASNRRSTPLVRTVKTTARKPSAKPVSPVKKGKATAKASTKAYTKSIGGSSAKKPVGSKGKGLNSILTRKKR